MDIRTPEPEKIPVVSYDFRNQIGTKVLSVDIWPSLGDSVSVYKDRYVFLFPRLRTEQEVAGIGSIVLSVEKIESERVYNDPSTLVKKVLEARREREQESNGKA